MRRRGKRRRPLTFYCLIPLHLHRVVLLSNFAFCGFGVHADELPQPGSFLRKPAPAIAAAQLTGLPLSPPPVSTISSTNSLLHDQPDTWFLARWSQRPQICPKKR